MRVTIVGTDPPQLPGVRVGVQRGRETVDARDLTMVRDDAEPVVFTFEVTSTGSDFRGPYVHGRPGERFLYLVWEREEQTFRRAKLMLTADLAAQEALTGILSLRGADGSPVCASVRPPAITWTMD